MGKVGPWSRSWGRWRWTVEVGHCRAVGLTHNSTLFAEPGEGVAFQFHWVAQWSLLINNYQHKEAATRWMAAAVLLAEGRKVNCS